MKPLRLGTRGSDLARAQTALVEQALRVTNPAIEIAVKIITTSGDEKSRVVRPPIDPHAGRKGLFTGEIERALASREIDVAIHSAKDLPSETTFGLEVCATLPRAAVEDVLVAKGPADLRAVKTVATGSVRRQHQLRWLRPDLTVVDLRGNVPTRLRKLRANDWDAIVLARAGLERLGFDCSLGALTFDGEPLSCAILPTEQFLPAGGQGAVALQIRADDADTREVIAQLNHPETLLCLRAEREFLRRLQGDCGTPVGVLATMRDGVMSMRAQFFDGGNVAPRTAALRKEEAQLDPEAIGAELLELINGG